MPPDATKEYIRAETARVEAQSLAGVKTLADCTGHRSQYHADLLEMLGHLPTDRKLDLSGVASGGG